MLKTNETQKGINNMFSKGKSRSNANAGATSNKSFSKAVVAVVIAGAAWVGLTGLNAYILTDKNIKEVVVASQDIQEGVEITEENAKDYFTTKSVNTSLITGTTLTSIDDIKGKTLISLSTGEIISSNMFINTAIYKDDIENPINISFGVGSADKAVNGYIRKGDVVDIYVSETVEGETVNTKIRSNVYIEHAYDSSYVEIGNGDIASLATFFTISVEEDQAKLFNDNIAKGSIILTKTPQSVLKEKEEVKNTKDDKTETESVEESTEDTEVINEVQAPEQPVTDTPAEEATVNEQPAEQPVEQPAETPVQPVQ